MIVDKVQSIIYRVLVEQKQVILVEDTGYLLESAKLPEVRESVAVWLRGITQQICILDQESFVALGWFCSAMLDNIDTKSEAGLD